MEKGASWGLNEVLLKSKIFELTKLVWPSDTGWEPAKNHQSVHLKKKLMWLCPNNDNWHVRRRDIPCHLPICR